MSIETEKEELIKTMREVKEMIRNFCGYMQSWMQKIKDEQIKAAEKTELETENTQIKRSAGRPPKIVDKENMDIK